VAGDSSSWHELLIAARERLRVTRAELARRAGVPAGTLRRWEDGTRRPPEARLRALLEALDCPSAEANAVLKAAGFQVQHTLFPEDVFPNYYYTVEELQSAVEDVPWPEFVLNDRAEVVAANRAIQALWRVDYQWEKAHRTAAQMNLLSVASDHRFAEHLVNWEEAIGALIGAFKASPVQPRSPDDPSDVYFNAVLGEFARGDPAFLQRLLRIWESTPPMEPKCRWTFPVVWRDDEFGTMRLINVINTASEPDGLAFNDWVPVDAESWAVLQRVKARGLPPGPRRNALR
jgi:transcriptional regulator with XRE-family HTH domain